MSTVPITLTDAAAALRAGSVTSRQLTEASIATAEAVDGRLGAYLARFDDAALATADTADKELAAGLDRGPLHGIPFGIKDIIATKDGPTTAQSLVLDRSWGAGKDAPTAARLRAAGAVITGKASTMEFACGMPDLSKPFPPPRNPWNLDTWPGGSSSGTGAGVAAGLFLAGLGTDTAGSIRIPAAFCGVSGLMPTFGRVPKSGCVPLGYSLDHIGPLARSARDCAEVLAVIAGQHLSDPDSVDAPFEVSDWADDLTGLRIGVVRAGHFPDGSDPALAGAFDATLAEFGALGAELVEVELPYWTELRTANLVTMACEALAYHRADMGTRWTDYFASTRAMLARGALVSGADYVQAQRVRRVAQDAIARLFDQVDLVICPTTSTPAPRYDELTDENGHTDIEQMFTMIHTGYWDCLGNPVLALPMGVSADGLPLSVQLAARPFEEATALRAGDAFQQHTDWHLRVPEITPSAAVAA